MTEKPIDHRQKTERRKDGTFAVLEALAKRTQCHHTIHTASQFLDYILKKS